MTTGSMPPDVDSNRIAAAKKREAKAEFMRAFALAWLRNGNAPPTVIVAQEARRMWDAIEAEASK